MFFKFLCKVTLLVFKNNLRIILGSKSKEVKNIKSRLRILRYFNKRVYFIETRERLKLVCGTPDIISQHNGVPQHTGCGALL